MSRKVRHRMNEKQPITDRKLRVLHVVAGGGRGLYSPALVGCDTESNWYFQGRDVYAYTPEEFEAAIGPFEERIRQADAGQTE